MKKLTQSQVQEIEMLQRDKIIYAVEAIATSCTCFFIFVVAKDLVADATLIGIILATFSTTYCLYMGIGNYFRLSKINKIKSESSSGG